MVKTLPTERLTSVLAEAILCMSQFHALRLSVSQVVRDWGVMPEEARLAELREALDLAAPLTFSATIEATAYLRLNTKRLESSRNAARRRRGLQDRHYDVDLPEFEGPQPQFKPTLTLDEIEEKLKGLETS